MSDIFNGPWLNQQDYERFVHLNLISRVNSLELIAHELGAKLQVAQGRVEELERPLCIGETTIRILAKEGAKVFEDGRALVAADELFAQDPYGRIAELEAALKPFADIEPYINSRDEQITYAFTEHMSKAARKALEKGDDNS